MVKKIFYGMLSIGVALILVYLLAVYKNNRTVPVIDKNELQQHLEKAIVWVVNNKQKISNMTSPVLWWMIHEAHEISGDKRLSDILITYHKKNSFIKISEWSPLFGSQQRSYINPDRLENLPYYNKHLIYALNCASNLEYAMPIVSQQNNENFCHQLSYIHRPACITHQLMGMNFIKMQSCAVIDNVDSVIGSLQDDVVNQLTWDVRVVDVYLQRVMMLLITGQAQKVKPVWVKQVLAHQLEDGGWGDFDKLINLWGNRSLGLSSKIISINSEKSNFHATAQGIYLLTWLIYSESGTELVAGNL